MKKTKTIEVDVCDQCGAEVEKWHIKICPTCKKEICPNCVVHFDLSIRKVEPSRQSNGLFASTVHTRLGYDIGLNGTYCSVCGNDIERSLIAAGLQKKEIKARESVVMD